MPSLATYNYLFLERLHVLHVLLHWYIIIALFMAWSFKKGVSLLMRELHLCLILNSYSLPSQHAC